jgi:hypothetical protein
MMQCNIMKPSLKEGFMMLMFLATLSASVIASLLVAAMDIECTKQPRRRIGRAVKMGAGDVYCDNGVAGALR